MAEHSPEPWEVTEVGAGEFFIVKFEPGGDGWERSIGEIDRLADAKRICACVNACRNIPTEWLETKRFHLFDKENDWGSLADVDGLLGLVPVVEVKP